MKWPETILELLEYSREQRLDMWIAVVSTCNYIQELCVIPGVNEELLQSRAERPLERKGKRCYCEM